MSAEDRSEGGHSESGHEVVRLVGDAPGPTLILVGAMHGNEPLGLDAARAVLEELREERVAIRGEVILFVANRAALAAGQRFLQRDFNREWTEEGVAAALAAIESNGGDVYTDVETRALAELAIELDGALARARGPAFAVDLHTTSATGPPFAIVGSSEAERAFAARFPLAGVTRLDDQIAGLLVHYLVRRGCISIAVEGGQHGTQAAADNLRSVATIALAAAGCLSLDAIPDGTAHWQRLLAARGDLPALTEIVSRHEVREGSDFRMEPGFANVQRTKAGTLLAREDGRELRAPFDGMVLMPRYQPLGSDGYFFGRELVD